MVCESLRQLVQYAQPWPYSTGPAMGQVAFLPFLLAGQLRALHLIQLELMTWCRHTWVRFSSLCKGVDKVSIIVPPDVKSL